MKYREKDLSRSLRFYYLDQHLKWKEHINVTKKQLPKTYKAWPYSDKPASTIDTFTPTKTIQIHCGAALTEPIWENFKVDKNTLWELSFTKTNLYIHENFPKKTIHQVIVN